MKRVLNAGPTYYPKNYYVCGVLIQMLGKDKDMLLFIFITIKIIYLLINKYII